MPAKSTAYSGDLLSLTLNNAPFPPLATSAATAGSLYVSLHTSSAGMVGGTQAQNEAGWSGYSRVAVARNSGQWAVSSNQVTPVFTISFPACIGGSETDTYFGIGTSGAGSSLLLYFGPVSPALVMSNSVTAQLTTASVINES